MEELEIALAARKGDMCMGMDGMNIGIFKGGESPAAREVLLAIINEVLVRGAETPRAVRWDQNTEGKISDG